MVLWLCFIAATSMARGHVVTQIYGEWKAADSAWQIEILFDAGYAVPEWRGDESAPAPRREWLAGLGEAGWAPLRAEAERYLRECLAVESAAGVSEWEVVFPDFAETPPDFPVLLNDGAYFRMELRGTERLVGTPIVRWAEGERPTLVLRLPGKEGQGAYLSLPAGQSAELAGGRPDWHETFRQGFLHVVPEGWDHVLFVMGLFFYRRAWRPLLAQSLAFTAAHTVTLGLAAGGLVRVSGGWVEPVIALSLVAVALENLRSEQPRAGRVRLPIVFGFGLIHGLGFAGALSTWLQPGKGFMTALLSANLGVEAAQAAVLAVAWIATLRWHRTKIYRAVRLSGCLAIAATGAWWFAGRMGWMG